MIYHGPCQELANQLQDQSIHLIVTSPPYAQQRKKQYGGIPEDKYPQWTVDWMESFKPKLVNNGSVAIVIRPHIRNGQISDYVLKTRLELRSHGWFESEELVWIKPDSPPLGHIQRPRRAWESILWFSNSRKPFCNPKANGTASSRVGFESTKGVGDYKNGTSDSKEGTARCRDYIAIGTGAVDKSKYNTHPAQYPEKLAQWIIRLLCPPDGTVCDPFLGSGTTAVACKSLNASEGKSLKFFGSEIIDEYVQIARNRLNETTPLEAGLFGELRPTAELGCPTEDSLQFRRIDYDVIPVPSTEFV